MIDVTILGRMEDFIKSPAWDLPCLLIFLNFLTFICKYEKGFLL